MFLRNVQHRDFYKNIELLNYRYTFIDYKLSIFIKQNKTYH